VAVEYDGLQALDRR